MEGLFASLTITAWTTVVLASWMMVLTSRVIFSRRTQKVGYGDGGDHDFKKRIRGHANAAEQVPISLILLALCELGGVPTGVVLSLAGLLIAGRLVHGAYFSWAGMPFQMRTLGMGFTLLAQGLLILTLLWVLLTA